MKLLLALLLFLFTSYTQACGWEESPEVGELFNNAADQQRDRRQACLPTGLAAASAWL